MNSLKEDYAYYKKSQRRRYGHYCNQVRTKGEAPLPYYKWQELDNKKYNKQ